MRLGKIKRFAALILVTVVLTTILSPVEASGKVIPGGMPFGVRLCLDGVLVVGVGEVETAAGKRSPAREAGIKPRDVIVGIDDMAVKTVEELVGAVSRSEGKSLSFSVRRDGGELEFEVTPVASADGGMKTGILVRDSTAGIGTVTFIDPATGAFAGLGHGICDSETGELMPLFRGIVTDVRISGVVKGQAGVPGELKGSFSSGKRGSLIGNTECGVFGVFSEIPEGLEGCGIETAEPSEITEGDAELICTIGEEGRQRYRAKISDIDSSGREVKNFVVTVTDERLLAKTGGIVQGMSGSPLIQNGKLIGAVTHVMIGDPSRGYGIFITNMQRRMPMVIS